MTSPALRHRQAKLAAIAASGGRNGASGAPAMPTEGPVASEYQLLLMALGEDLRALSNIQSRERKIEAKRAMIARYVDWVKGALEAEAPAQDEIVTTMMIWTIDLGSWDDALKLAKHVLEHGLTLPERYKRNPATLIAEEIAEAGLTNPPTVEIPDLLSAHELTANFDMHDQARAKLAKAIGQAFKAEADSFDPDAETAVAGGKPALIATAIDWLTRALTLDSKVGAKKLIEALERDQKKLAEAPAPATS